MIATSVVGPNCVHLRSIFIHDTEGKGVLYVISHVMNRRIDFTRSLYLPVGRKEAENGTKYVIPNGEYSILAYDIEYNGRIQQSGFPSSTSSIYVNGSNIGLSIPLGQVRTKYKG